MLTGTSTNNAWIQSQRYLFRGSLKHAELTGYWKVAFEGRRRFLLQ